MVHQKYQLLAVLFLNPNIAPKLTAGNVGGPNSNAYIEGTGIYIGRLPYDVTKSGIMEVVKKFDSIQIRRHEDGFCCGFGEFERADSAHRAVEVTMAEEGLHQGVDFKTTIQGVSTPVKDFRVKTEVVLTRVKLGLLNRADKPIGGRTLELSCMHDNSLTIIRLQSLILVLCAYFSVQL